MGRPVELQSRRRFGSWTVLRLGERIEKRRMALSVARGRRVEVALGISRWHPDPIAAIERAEAEASAGPSPAA
jgi:hypothetical protein